MKSAGSTVVKILSMRVSLEDVIRVGVEIVSWRLKAYRVSRSWFF